MPKLEDPASLSQSIGECDQFTYAVLTIANINGFSQRRIGSPST